MTVRKLTGRHVSNAKRINKPLFIAKKKEDPLISNLNPDEPDFLKNKSN